MDDKDELELLARITDLQQTLLAIGKSGISVEGRQKKRDAEFMALYSLVQELAMHEGIATQEFRQHYEKRVNYFHQQFLQTVESTSPSLAAELDTRPIDGSAGQEDWPPLFDSQ